MTRRAVSTIEALLCIVVMAAVSSALTPLQAGESRDFMRKTCLSNLKQTGTATAIYESDCDDWMPPSRGWMDTVMPYIKNESIYHCPEVTTKQYGYAYNSLMAGKNVDRIKHPDQEPLEFDSIHLERSASATIKSMPSPARHEGKNNLSYIDTHAKSITGG